MAAIGRPGPGWLKTVAWRYAVKKVTIKDVPSEATPTSWASVLINSARISVQRLLQPGDSDNYMFGLLRFGAGSRSKFHTHSGDQILVIVEGTGKIATENEVLTVTERDAVLIPAGESHWHGAPDDTPMAHIYVLVAEDHSEPTEP